VQAFSGDQGGHTWCNPGREGRCVPHCGQVCPLPRLFRGGAAGLAGYFVGGAAGGAGMLVGGAGIVWAGGAPLFMMLLEVPLPEK
jgi:hypothetical protein